MRRKAVVGYEGLYTVSESGEVRSVRTGRVLAEGAWKGYKTVALSKEGRARRVWVHTLVAYAFLGPRPDGMQIRHRDGVRLNNHYSNLIYGTWLDNVMDNYRNGLYRTPPLTRRKRVAIRRLLREGLRQVEVARRLGVGAHLVHRESKAVYREQRAALFN